MLKIVFLVALVLVCVVANNDDEQVPAPGPMPLPNIGFLGRGYDILRADPRPLTKPMDSGFVSGIFDMTSYELGRKTADGRHVVPDYTDVVECTACQLSYEANIVSGAYSYKNSLNRHVSGDTDLGFSWFGIKFSFRASEAYMKTVEETSNYKNVLVDTAASCIVYCAELRLPLKPTNLDAAFVEAVRLLPINATSEMLPAYFGFLRKFGTHVVSGMQAGSLFWQRHTFSSENYEKAVKETSDVGIETAAGLSFLGLSFGANFGYQTSKETNTSEKFNMLANSLVFHSIGAPPPTRQGPYNTTSRWLKETRQSPMPIEFRLLPITFMLTSQFFPGEINIEQKRANLQAVIEEGGYCRFLASVTSVEGSVNCGEELPDTIIKKPTVKSNFGGTYYKADFSDIRDIPNPITGIYDCPPGYSPVLIGGGDYQLSACPSIPGFDTLPGYFYMCRNGTSDPQGAFYGFVAGVNDAEFSYKKLKCDARCGTTRRDNRYPGGKYDILIARSGWEYVYASYSPVPGAYVGGFYLIDSRPEDSWINPATGVTSCPAGYQAHLLFSSKEKGNHCLRDLVPFESYVCLLKA